MVVDLSEDNNPSPNYLSKTRLDLAHKLLDEYFPQSKFAYSKDELILKHVRRDRVLFDLALKDLASNSANGCLLCDYLLRGCSNDSEWNPWMKDPDEKCIFALNPRTVGFEMLRLQSRTPNFDSERSNDENYLKIDVHQLLCPRLEMLAAPGMCYLLRKPRHLRDVIMLIQLIQVILRRKPLALGQ